ncbi:bifunctional folylpolyglutamate synthase/dihydrofolate synthase [Leptolyngbya sp. BL0902]|uniref:bifunctional folylpolyglutamate synthase/dihydrofolate synthase n=1 Tax=Leptolyngbya sp. BL0902 TaxID=1115757 RepID=UPI0018E79132|nr:folylpolyglutamate synthase/dihydrofolate synthase family protein [Leptolyngbya sp. BL0902]QQE66343.1 bifunctional folylpolyglutamate synthase/dihydrofolate synthase [Leptolyngbya sp. BL0902]
MTTADSQITALLDGFGRFGVDLGLERIEVLLGTLGYPQRRVPMIHVAGSNGKGSVCAYLSSVLGAAGYRVGRYTSPHLVSWRERICINDQPIAAEDLRRVLDRVIAAIDPDQPSPTQFEVFTAAAWLYFAESEVDVAVIEVGLGGRLDATNVVETPLVSVITSLSREHWQRLGPTLADIAREKAGILKPGRPAVVGPLPPEAEAVVKARLAELDCPVVWPHPAQPVGEHRARYEMAQDSLTQDSLTYPLPFPGEHQLTNSALAVAALLELRRQGWDISDAAIVQGMGAARWPGRLQWIRWQDDAGQAHPLLIDGAHNPAAAQVLRRYVDAQLAKSDGLSPTTTPTATQGVAWLMGMLTTKDHREVFEALLRPGDSLYLVPVPEHLSADPSELAAIAKAVCPDLSHCGTYADLRQGLTAMVRDAASLKVFCGSLYLIGHFFATESQVTESYSRLEKA